MKLDDAVVTANEDADLRQRLVSRLVNVDRPLAMHDRVLKSMQRNICRCHVVVMRVEKYESNCNDVYS